MYDKSHMMALTEILADSFDRDSLARICEMGEDDFAAEFEMTVSPVPQKWPADFYAFRDNGSNILAVAHLDTVGLAHERRAHFVDTESAGTVVYSRGLDDRLGAYIILDLLPSLGIEHDILLTVGEESGRSTAQFFETTKSYDWMIEFDRGGTDVVMYQFEDFETVNAVEDSGARVGDGSFSDICYLEHLGIKGFNWGVGYRDYHGPRAHAYLDDTFKMVAHYLRFHAANLGVSMPHDGARYGNGAWWDEDDEIDGKDFVILKSSTDTQ